MKIAVMQPYLFPYIGYFQLIDSVDKFVLFDDVNYINKGWINRNRILVNGNAFLFTVPLLGASQNKLINEIELEPGDKWRGKLLKTITGSYSKAPYYRDALPIIEEIIFNAEKNLSVFLYHSIIRLTSYLGIKTEIVPSSSIYPNQELKGEDRILDICVRETADTYVNPIGGTELYSKEKFSGKGINLFFVKTHEITYKQFDKPFVPWLSVIDLMMFCSKEELAGALANRELI
ncbi:MAG TPA: WbqC family protein [Chitinophagales bacterium]|nr:WbqC family protein [Chitinophagales bacterium]